jgi:peptidoglycan-associated lipoprotein
MKIKLVALLLLFVPIALFSQKVTEKADAAFEAGQYIKAIELYRNAYSKLTEEIDIKGKIAYNVGYCFRVLSKPELAELWFAKAVELKYRNPLSFLYYAEALRQDEKYDEAIEQYLNYKKGVPDDGRIEAGLKSCHVAKKWMINPSKYKITNNAFINTDKSDFCASFADSASSSIVFTSSYQDSATAKINSSTGQPFARLFSSSKNAEGEWSSPSPLNLNKDGEQGTPSISSDFTEMYFTRCESSVQTKNTCKIYLSKKSGDVWGNAEQLKFLSIVYDTFAVAQPAISPDGLRLYFSSNIPKGFGGYDIWYVERKSKEEKWSDPVNAGDRINTKGNDMYPYVRQDNTFFFSSDGHHGMGGLDMFRINKDPKNKDQIVNLMYPMNSTGDDFGIVYVKNSERGFFTSNRKGSKGYDDIWQFSLPSLSFSVAGILKDENLGKPMKGCSIKLIGNDGSVKEITTDSTGAYKFEVKPSTNYIVMATMKGYLNSKGKISTDGIETNKDFKLDLYMAALDIPIELPNVLYDLGKWDLRPESIVSLEKMVDLMNDNPNIVVELSSHTDNRPIAKMTNLELSQKRAESVVDFLIKKGVDTARLVPKGYGDTRPRKVDRKINFLYPFLDEGTVLNKAFIDKMPADKRETAHQINRRTEFKVISTNYSKK